MLKINLNSGEDCISKRLTGRLQQRFNQEFLPRWDKEWGGKFILHGGSPQKNALRLDGNDYLALSGHHEVTNSQIKELSNKAKSIVQSGVFYLDEDPARRLALDLAQWIGKDNGFIAQSGFAANTGLLQVIADSQTPVYIDALAHASLWEGAHTARAPIFGFRHNDPAHLARLISHHGPGIVAVDSVYSTTGAMCRLEEILNAIKGNESLILVDESHSLGTHGPGGRGICAALGVTDKVDFISASLAKTFAGRAGFFTIPAELHYYMLTSNRSNIFSSGLLPYEIAGLAAAWRVIQRDDEARARLAVITQRLRRSLQKMGFPVHQGTEQIIALEAGSEPDTMALRDELERHNIIGAIFCAPATSKNRAMVRLSLNSGLTDDQLDYFETAMQQVAKKVHPQQWPIAKRHREHNA